MSNQRAALLAPEAPRPTRPSPPAADDRPATTCRPPFDGEDPACPACGDQLRLWANYHRCRNCGYKESCCF